MEAVVKLLLGKRQPTIAEDCDGFAARLRSVSLPLSPYDNNTRHVVTTLTKRHLQMLLDSVFGPMMTPRTELPRPSWLHKLDTKPSDTDERALLELLSPEGPLFRVLLELSPPVAAFDERLRENWKNEFARPNTSSPTSNGPAGEGDAEEPFGDVSQPVPLSVLTSQHYIVLGEKMDCDLAALPSDRVPSFMVLPAWHPPIRMVPITVDTNDRESMMCLAVSPAAYFIIRLLTFLPQGFAEEDFTSELMLEAEQSWATKIDDFFVGSFKRARALLGFASAQLDPNRPRFVLYRELLRRYIRYLVPKQPSVLPSHIPRGRGAGRQRQATAQQVLGALIAHTAPAMWQRFQQPLSEADRSPPRDVASLSILLNALRPFIEICDALPRTAALSSGHHDALPDGLSLATMRDEVAFPLVTTYRYGLRLLRQTAISIPWAPRCPLRHTVAMFDTFLALTRLDRDVRGDMRAFQRYELFSVGLRDVLQCLADAPSCFVGFLVPPKRRDDGDDRQRTAADHAASVPESVVVDALQGLTDMFRAFEDSREFTVTLHQISNAIESMPRAGRDTVAQLREFNVLRWVDQDDGPSEEDVIPIFTGALPSLAARLSTALQSRLALCEGQATRQAIQRLLDTMGTVFPETARARENLNRVGPRTQGKQLPASERADDTTRTLFDRDAKHTAGSSFITSTADGSMSARSARRHMGSLRLDGRRTTLLADLPASMDETARRSASASACRDVVFDPRRERARRSDEIPALITLTKHIDSIIEALQFRYSVYRGTIPRCRQSGLPMTADPLPVAAGGSGSWYCAETDSTECETASAPRLQNADGLEVVPEPEDSEHSWRAVVCDRCLTMLPSPETSRQSEQRYVVELTGGYLCPRCASRPYRVISTRWFASNTAIVVVGLMLLLLAFCWASGCWPGSSKAHGGPQSRAQWREARMAPVEDIDDML